MINNVILVLFIHPSKYYISINFLRFFENDSRENSSARFRQSSRIFCQSNKGTSSRTICNRFTPDSGVISIRVPVFPSITVSFSPHSFAPITGTPHAIDSTGDIPKSSSTGIYIIAIAFATRDINTASLGAGIGKMFLHHSARAKSLSFSGSFFP